MVPPAPADADADDADADADEDDAAFSDELLRFRKIIVLLENINILLTADDAAA